MECLTFINTGNSHAIPTPKDRPSRQDNLLKRFGGLQRRAPNLSEDDSIDIPHSIAIARHRFDVHSFSVVLHHHLVRNNTSDSIRPPGRHMFQSGRRVLQLFDYIYTPDTSRSILSWTDYVEAYPAAVMFGVACLRQDVKLPTESSLIQPSEVFKHLTINRPDLSIARLAAKSLETLATVLKNIEDDRENLLKDESVQFKHSPKISGRPETSSHMTRNKRQRDVEPQDTRQPKTQRRLRSVCKGERLQHERAEFSAETSAFAGCELNVSAWTRVPEYSTQLLGQPSYPFGGGGADVI